MLQTVKLKFEYRGSTQKVKINLIPFTFFSYSNKKRIYTKQLQYNVINNLIKIEV